MVKRKNGFNGERALVLPQFVIQEMEKHPVSSILHITDIGFYPKALYHYRERKEPITQYVFIYCTEGSGWYQINEEKHLVKANQYFILPAGVAHAYGANDEEPWTIYWIHFKGTLAPYLIEHISHPIEIRPESHSRISNRIEMFEEIFRTLEMGYSYENLLYACTTFYHYLGTLRYLQQYRNATDHHENSNDFITVSIHYMKENIEKKLTIKELADLCNYAPAYFSYLFFQRTGYSPIVYFNQLKIQKACQLLDFTHMKSNQICYKIGMDDPHYFSRLFKKIMGMSPREYKTMKKG